MEIIARRLFSPIYIYFDIAFLVLFLGLLIYKKKYMTVVVGLLAGVLYFLVDYGIFHLFLHTRTISEGHSLFWVLLWMSLSYGFTNFTWIWLWISKDKNLFIWSFLIVLWWFCCPLLTKLVPGYSDNMIVIQRTTGEYHSYMALILAVGYLGVIIFNLIQKEKKNKIDIPWILAIGILVQLSWELALLIGNIRSAGMDFENKFQTLCINSLLETNLGKLYIYAIFIAYNSRFTEQLKKRENTLTFMQSLNEINGLSLKNH